MEDRARFIARFSSQKDMIYIFPEEGLRIKTACDIFQERWDNALVTVKKLNGEMFFID